MFFLFSWIKVDPNPIFFYIPIINHPITWYGCIFALAFWLGYRLFIWMYIRYRLNNIEIPTKYKKTEIPENRTLNKKDQHIIDFFKKYGENRNIKNIELRLYLEQEIPEKFPSTKDLAVDLADRGLLYIILGTIIGARLGHIIFYENILNFLLSPLSIFKVWEGGLASHGGIAAIILSSYLFSKKSKTIPYIAFLDLLSIPTMLVCGFIRIGNFINQEILGGESTMPWAIIFTHPADGSALTPRHPIQLYEAILYFSVFISLFILWKRNFSKKLTGFYIGLALIISFTLRFLLEFFKTTESIYDQNMILNMGQILSIPMMFLGYVLIIWSMKKKLNLDKKKQEY